MNLASEEHEHEVELRHQQCRGVQKRQFMTKPAAVMTTVSSDNAEIRH